MSDTVRLRSLPEVGARMPGFVPRVVLALVGALLCLDRLPGGFWFVLGVALALLAAVAPRWLAAWGLILLLGASQALQHPSGFDWGFLVLLAGVHLLHVLAAQTLVLPVNGWVQLAVFRRPLLRFLVVQVAVQAIAVLVLTFLTPGTSVPVLGVVGAIALVLLALVLAVPLLRERAR